MKKINISLFILSFSFFLFSCENAQEKKDYKEIKDTYSSFIRTNPEDIDNLENKAESLKRNMQIFILNYPDSKYYSEINSLLMDIDNNISDKLYNSFLDKKNRIRNKDFSSYENQISEYENMISEGELIYNKIKNKPLSDRIIKLVDDIKDDINLIVLEKNDYDLLSSSFKTAYTIEDADIEIEQIDYFLNKYQSSIMSNILESRIESLILLKFNILYKQNIDEIQKLNSVIKKGYEFINKLTDKDIIDDIKSRINVLENSRRTLFKKEWDVKSTEMSDKMKNEAIDFSNIHVHNICKSVLSINLVDETKNKYINKTVIYREYQLQNKGGFLCNKLFKTIIRVKAVITGNIQDGVQYDIDAELISDLKIN